jgi:hypothetical protein
MRHPIASISDTITTAFGKCRSGIDVVNLATLRLRAVRYPRCLITWLTDGVLAGLQVVGVRHLRPVVAVGGTARVLRHERLGTLGRRRGRMEPGSGASLRRF